MSKLLEQFVKEEYISRPVPDFRVGDIVRVHQVVPDIKAEKKLSKTAKAIQKSQEAQEGKGGSGERIQVFEGVVIVKKHGREPGASFTVRKIASHNVGVEKIFPLYSPLVKEIEVVSRPHKVRRAKLYFLRKRVGKKARRLGIGTAVEQEVTSVGAVLQEEGEDTSDKTQDTNEAKPETTQETEEKTDESEAEVEESGEEAKDVEVQQEDEQSQEAKNEK